MAADIWKNRKAPELIFPESVGLIRSDGGVQKFKNFMGGGSAI